MPGRDDPAPGRMERGSRRAPARLPLQGLRRGDRVRRPAGRGGGGGEPPSGHRHQLERRDGALVDAREARDHGPGRRHGPAHGRARLVLLGALIAALVAGGCGSESGDGEADGTARGEPMPATALTITFWPEGRTGPAQEAELTCDPGGGTHPSPAEACKALRANADALAPLPPDSICTQIYGGAQGAGDTGGL